MKKNPNEPPRCSCSCAWPTGKWLLYVIAAAVVGFLVVRFLL